MTANINPETGIRYGVIACQSLDPDLVQELWYGPQATDLSYKTALEELRVEVTREVEFEQEDGYDIDDIDEEIEDRFQSRAEWIQIEEPTIPGTYEGVEYQIGWLGGAPLLWVLKSPYMTYRSPCSPCVPNAIDLDSDFDPHGTLGYNVPADWRAKDDREP